MPSYRFLLLALLASMVIFLGGIVDAKPQRLLYPIPASASDIPLTKKTQTNLIPTQRYNTQPLTYSVAGVKASNVSLGYPLGKAYPVTSFFGMRVHPIKGDRRLHAGVDIGAPYGTPVLASRAGRVVFAGRSGGYGNTVILEHSNPKERTLYAHLSKITVHQAQLVEAGTVVGQVGSTGLSTGAHLHFEVRQPTNQGWQARNPVGRLGKPGQLPPPSSTPPAPPIEDIPECDVALWGECTAPPRCDVVLFGECQ